MSDLGAIELEVGIFQGAIELDERYRAGQEATYRRHPTSLGAIDPGPTGADCIVLARGPEGQAWAGMRAHLRRLGEQLPVERSLGDLCPISAAVDRVFEPLTQPCGTWVARDDRIDGVSLAVAVVAATIAGCRALGARRIVGFSHQHALPLYRTFGATVDDQLGVHPYPTEQYQTCVIWSDPYICGQHQALVDTYSAHLQAGRPLLLDPPTSAA